MGRVAYVVGQPIGHSLSPHMHNAAFAACGIDATYLPAEVASAELASWLREVSTPLFLGCSVTVPHKEAVMPYLDHVEGDAILCGAVNMIRRTADGQLIGANTDTIGFRRSLAAEANRSLAGQNVVILGAGGAARALAVVAFQDRAAAVTLANRHVERAWHVLEYLAELAGATPVGAVELAGSDLDEALERADVVVNATSVGLRSTLSPIDPLLIRPSSLVVDIVYNPTLTALLAGAQRRGAPVLGGLGMLVYQAAAAFEVWTGLAAPVAVMRAAAEQVLAAAGSH